MIITMLGKEQAFSAPATVQQIIKAMAPEYEKTALGCFCGGKALELNETVSDSCSLHPITFQNEEGRRIYERSLRFVLLLALHRVLPESDVRIEHSIGYGVYMRLLDRDADQQTVDALQAEMETIVRENLPFVRETWSREKAIELLESTEAKCRALEEETKQKCAEMAEAAKQEADSYWREVSEKMEHFYQEHEGLKEMLDIPEKKLGE